MELEIFLLAALTSLEVPAPKLRKEKRGLESFVLIIAVW